MGKPRINGCDEDGKALYEERPFHSKPVHGGYRTYCKRCKTTTLSNAERLPHDVATDHRCLYNPKDIDDAAS